LGKEGSVIANKGTYRKEREDKMMLNEHFGSHLEKDLKKTQPFTQQEKGGQKPSQQQLFMGKTKKNIQGEKTTKRAGYNKNTRGILYVGPKERGGGRREGAGGDQETTGNQQ